MVSPPPAPVMPRKVGLEQLVSILLAEHVQMVEKLATVKRHADNRDYPAAAKAIRELDALFRQHIVDEEAQVLRLLIDAYGVKGAEEAIVIFRQHRPIYTLVEEVKKLASLSAEELASNEASLKSLLEGHTKSEEDRIFPMALFLPRADLPIKFQGRIACSLEMPDKKSRHAHVGIEFLGLTQEDESRLTAFLETLMVIPIREKLSRLFRKIFFLQEKPRRAG